MASNSSTPSTSNTASTSNMTVNESNFTESNVTMNISTQSKSRELPTNSITVEGNITSSNLNVQINTGSMPRALSKLCYFPKLPETVDKREGDVGNLHKLMIEHHKVVVTGIAGLGKTTLANLCARKWVEDGTYQHVIFVNMETEESASAVYKRLAKNVLNTKDDDYSEDTILEIYQYFSEYHILIIFDNIDENCVFHKYYPSEELTNIDILGTSQLTELKGLFHLYPLQVLSEEASVQLIRDIFSSAKIEVPGTVDPMITDLVVQLESHPLALQHAAALVIDMFHYDIPKVSLEQSLNKYKQHFETKLDKGFPTDHPSEYRKPVYAAISLNIQKATIGKEHVKSLLHCMTYLDSSHIGIQMLYKVPTFSTDQFEESLKLLRRFSLISVDRDIIISMHRLIPEVCHVMSTADDKIKYLNTLFDIFFHNIDNNYLLPIRRQCSFFIEHFQVNFNIKKEKLAAYYKDAFHNNQQIKERLTARLQMINCEISDTDGWSVQQCCVFARHQTFFRYFDVKESTCSHSLTQKGGDTLVSSEAGFVEVITNSSLNVFGYTSILEFYKYNKEELNKPIFKSLTILSISAAFGIREHDFNELIDMGCDVNIKDDNGMTPISWAAQNMSYDIVFSLLHHGATCDDGYKEVLTAAAAGDGETVLRLLQTSKDNYATGEYGKTLLWWAAGNGHRDIVRELIERGTDTSGADGRGNTPLHMVASGGYGETISQFIGAGVDINIVNSDGVTALMHAVHKEHDKIVSQLIANKANVNIVNSDGWTALLCAVSTGHDKIVSKLIRAKADLNTVLDTGSSALIFAARDGHDKIVSQLIGAGANVNIANSDGGTALILAVDEGHDKIVSKLIAAEADVNFTNSDGDAALIIAASRGYEKIVTQLIAAKAINVNIADRYGNTALIIAAWYGHDNIMSKLIAAKADVNIANKYGNTALIYAATEGHDKITTQLFQADANVNVANNHGQTPLYCATMHGHREISMYLIEKGASVNAVDDDGDTPLHWAVVHGHRELVTELVNRGAHVDTAGEYSRTPLLLATKYKHHEISMYLIEKGASVNAVDDDGDTPLQWAVVHGHRELVTELVNRGAHVDTADEYGNTPLLLATEHNHHEISMYLIKNGASVNAVDDNGNTPLLFAAKHGDYELAVELINRGARTDPPANNSSETPLYWARENKDDRMEHIITSKRRRLD